MQDPEEVLRVRAMDSHITYIGGDFCPTPNGEKMRAIFESGQAELAVDINNARSDVQDGMSPEDAIETHRLNQKVNGVVGKCLGSIAAGKCRVYPK